MNFVIAIAMIVAPAVFLIYWGKSGFDYGGKKNEE
ncbi:hypothetical protein SAMN05421677_10782 [Halobacillus aidingensis]|uniref:Uncharacterized protein n=1 Tax=Halobacillus aidingensis TaxID=240303 RepID=A0A1H0LPW2_HALAD|nr:hypothetical protein SAMN05421677_10782 [Halobacillus aidingensis]